MTRQIGRCQNIEDIRKLAERRLPRPIYDYISAGSGNEHTLRRNTEAYDEVGIVPRVAVDVSNVDTSTTVLGRKLSFPLMVAPVGGIAFVHPHTEIDIAAAAARSGIMESISNYSAASLDCIAQACGAEPRMFQLYDFGDERLVDSMIRSAREAGYDAMCITVDVSVRVPRERVFRWQLRPGGGFPPMRTVAALALHPVWGLQRLRFRQPQIFDYHRRAAEWRDPATLEYHRADLTWKDVARLIKLWGGPAAVKGVLSAQDARRAVDAGASGVIICNHGGTGLNGAPATISLVEEIVDAVDSWIDVIQCGGLRSGDGILKALALGAKAVMTGRPFVYGSAAGRQAGVEKVIEIFRGEFELAMQLSGCRSVGEIDRTLLAR